MRSTSARRARQHWFDEERGFDKDVSTPNPPGAEKGQHFVSVIVPVYNDSARLMRCLQALEGQTYPDDAYEVIVVDNASEEDIASVVAPFSQARRIHEAKRGSYAARNRGIACARGDIIAFTDADCIPHDTWLECGVERLVEKPSCGLVGGRIEFFFSTSGQPSPAELFDSTHFLKQERYVKREKFAATANAFTWKWVFDDVGQFDDTLQSGGDTEWGQRVAAYGYDICYANKACVQHPARHSYSELRQKKMRIVEGTVDAKKTRGYPLHEVIVDVIKDVGHHVKYALQTVVAQKQYGWKERVILLGAFPVQGGCTAARRLWRWVASPARSETRTYNHSNETNPAVG